jgi:hypothetical protein
MLKNRVVSRDDGWQRAYRMSRCWKRQRSRVLEYLIHDCCSSFLKVGSMVNIAVQKDSHSLNVRILIVADYSFPQND